MIVTQKPVLRTAGKCHVYAWVEFNTSSVPPDWLVRWVKLCVDNGIEPIVTTTPAYVRLYERLSPGKVIPGVKDHRLRYHWGDPSAWANYGRALVEASEAAQRPEVCHEHESALEPIWRENNSEDFDDSGYAAGLESLPQHLTHWFYPGLFFDLFMEPYRLTWLQDRIFGAASKKLNSVRFFDVEIAKPPESNDWWTSRGVVLRKKVAKQPTIHIWYPDDNWKNRRFPFWKIGRINEGIDWTIKNGGDFCFYPGATDCERLTKLLIKDLRQIRTA